MSCSIDHGLIDDEFVRNYSVKKNKKKGYGKVQCGECGKKVEEYEIYTINTFLDEDDMCAFEQGDTSRLHRTDSHHTCNACVSVRNVFFHNWIFGEIWEDMEECLSVYEEFPEEKFAQLNPEAKDMFLEAWQENFDLWLAEEAEGDD